MKLLAALFVALLMVGCGEEAQKEVVVDKWAEWEANPEPYGGLEVLAKIKKAKTYGFLNLETKQISDISPLKELTNLKELVLNDNQISDLLPLAGLTELEFLYLRDNQISDVSPLKDLTNLKGLWLASSQIPDVSSLKGLPKLEALALQGNPIPGDQKAMLRKALPNCIITF